MTKMVKKYKLILLFIIAFLIRLIYLDQSLWLDEATTAIAVQSHSFWNIVTQFSPTDFHPPLYYLFMDIWTNIFGYSEVALRMPSVLFSMATGYVIYHIMKGSLKSARDDSVGFWSAAFFLFNPLIVYYSQEARMYSMVTFFIAVSFYYLVKHLTSNVKRLTSNFWLMNLFLILSFYTFYASVFYVGAVYILLLLSSSGLTRGSRILTWIPASAGMTMRSVFGSMLLFSVGILAISPLLMQQYAGSRDALASVTNWSLVLGKVTLKNLLLIPIKFTSGRISFHPKLLYYALAAGWLGIVGISVIPDLIRNLGALFSGSQVKPGMTMKRMILFFFISPLIIGIIFSLNSPLLQYFRFQYLIVFMSIGLGLAVSHSRLRSGIQYAILTGFISWSLLYLLFPQYHREDWKSLANHVQQNTSEVYMIPSSGDPIRYYAPGIIIQDIRELDSSVARSLRMTDSFGDLYVLPYTTDIHGVDYATTLLDQGYTILETKSFRELTLEKWNIL